MHGLDMLMTAKHYLGAALLVGHWPSRRMIRRLEADLAEAQQCERDLRRVVTVAAASADTVLQASSAWRRNRL